MLFEPDYCYISVFLDGDIRKSSMEMRKMTRKKRKTSKRRKTPQKTVHYFFQTRVFPNPWQMGKKSFKFNMIAALY